MNKIPFLGWLFLTVPEDSEWEGKLPKGFNDLLASVPPENRDLVHKQAINEVKLQYAIWTGVSAINGVRLLGLGAALFLLLLWLGGPAFLTMLQNQITK